MKKLLLILLTPLFFAFQCEPEPCMSIVSQKSKPQLITIENLQSTYQVGDILWLTSTLARSQNFENANEIVDLFSYNLDFAFGLNFYKSSIYNPEIYLCLNSNTTETTFGALNGNFGCNMFVYEKIGSELKCRIGIKLLETGNYTLSIYQISNFRETGLNCEDKGLNITTTFSNNNQQMIQFSVQ
jgi:hypothetical protein